MGGRGASSGISDKGKIYGTEYTTLFESENIKYVMYNDSESAKTPMETMTKGRIYVTVNKQGTLKSINYYDDNNKRFKQVDMDHYHGEINGNHTHKGYYHDENGTRKPTPEENKMIEKVKYIWRNRK
jgi:hypothetical protein